MYTLTFEQKHPFILFDGRRFATLACAGHSVNIIPERGDSMPVQCVTDERTGMKFSWRDCIDALESHDSAEWEAIWQPAKDFFSGLSGGGGSYAAPQFGDGPAC